MYNHFNPNPCRKNVGDCTVRAIVKATGKEWGEIYHTWRNTPAFRHGDISHTLFPRKKTAVDCIRYC